MVRHTQCGAVQHICSQLSDMDVIEAVCCVSDHLTNLRELQSEGSDLQRKAADLLLQIFYGLLPSIIASCITTQQPVTQVMIDLYQPPFECDPMSGKLKYSTMLYCSGQYDQAADMLSHCESLLGPNVAQYCSCHGRAYICQLDVFLRKGLNTSTVELLKTSSTSYVIFGKHELPCVPEHIRHEIYRTQTQNDKNQRIELHKWMDFVVIECVPFLYYLQYLVYREEGNLSMKQSAVSSVHETVCVISLSVLH